MEFDHINVRQVVEEDRLSSLPDEHIHMILSCFDMKFVVQTCLLSSRWKLLWTSMPCVNFSSDNFCTLRKFAEFVTRVLSHRNHQIDVSSVKLSFDGATNEAFVKQIAKYAFSHNVQELTVVRSRLIDYSYSLHEYPPWLFSSWSLEDFTLTYNNTTPWTFPALTTLHLSDIKLCDNMFTSCVNLKNLTLKFFCCTGPKVFDIITPRLSNLRLIHGRCVKVMNVIAPRLENLSVYHCSMEYLNAPPGISSLCYRGYHPMQLSKVGFHSLDKVSICLFLYYPSMEVACKTIGMLQEVHSARSLTLNEDIVECLSSFSDLLSRHPSPFRNLNCLTIDYTNTNTKRKDAHKETMSGQVKDFLLENSPSATLNKKLSKVPR